MELREISKKEFDSFALNHLLGSFQQTSFWGKFMEGEIFHPYYIGYFKKEKLIGASLLLSYQYINKRKRERIFYAPRGFLLDYKNEELVKSFTTDLKKFIKEKKGIFLRIDPYIIKKDLDNKGNVIDGGVSNDYIIENILSSGFVKEKIEIQPRFLSRINLKKKNITDIFDDFSQKTRQIVRRNEKLGFKIRELADDDLEKFIKIIEDESIKYNTICPTKDFFQDLRKAFPKENISFVEVYYKKDEVITNI